MPNHSIHRESLDLKGVGRNQRAGGTKCLPLERQSGLSFSYRSLVVLMLEQSENIGIVRTTAAAGLLFLGGGGGGGSLK